MTETDSSSSEVRRWSGSAVLSLFNYGESKQSSMKQHNSPTVVNESEDCTLGGDISASCTSSEASSSISVASVPLDVTGEGPTISLGLNIVFECLSKDVGCSEDDSAELRADLSVVSDYHSIDRLKCSQVLKRGEFCAGESGERENSV